MILSPNTINKLCKYVESELNKTNIILKDKLCTSRSKLPCTYCGVDQSTTWRPGPCGPSTLCNKCGVAYMDTGRRNRSIDLIMQKNVPVWCKRDASSWEWVIERKAPLNDPRVQMWIRHEASRREIKNKISPPPRKRARI
jgi:hypothetical protein